MASAKNFFSAEEQDQVVNAIAEAEMHTSGEIRVHLENFCLGNEVTAARKIFTRLGMHKTAERNGILIYIATYSHKIAVIGDEGIHQKVGTEFWQKLVDGIITKFREHRRAEALAECIVDCGRQLKTYFPRRDDDVNELNNHISY